VNEILAYIAGAGGLALTVRLFVSPYTKAAQHKTKNKMAAIGDAIEKETITAFTRMHENVADARAAASATTGMAETYAAMSEVASQNPNTHSYSSAVHASYSAEQEEFSGRPNTSHSTTTIEQYSPYWHDRTENPGALKF